jgi:hypothetical protein
MLKNSVIVSIALDLFQRRIKHDQDVIPPSLPPCSSSKRIVVV